MSSSGKYCIFGLSLPRASRANPHSTHRKPAGRFQPIGNFVRRAGDSSAFAPRITLKLETAPRGGALSRDRVAPILAFPRRQPAPSPGGPRGRNPAFDVGGRSASVLARRRRPRKTPPPGDPCVSRLRSPVFWLRSLVFWPSSLVFWLRSLVFWPRSLVFWPSSLVFWPSSLVFWLRSLVFWPRSLVFWSRSLVFWLRSLVFWPRSLVFWLRSLVSWT